MGHNWLGISYVVMCDSVLCAFRYALFRYPNMLVSLLFPLVAILSLILGARENRAAVCEPL